VPTDTEGAAVGSDDPDFAAMSADERRRRASIRRAKEVEEASKWETKFGAGDKTRTGKSGSVGNILDAADSESKPAGTLFEELQKLSIAQPKGCVGRPSAFAYKRTAP
jgi:hypothetical protein